MNITTITIEKALKKRLDYMKVHPRESYNDVLLRALSQKEKQDDPEAVQETIEILSDPEIMHSLARSVEQLKKGKVYGFDQA
jgi:predicted CopG family antitoxin